MRRAMGIAVFSGMVGVTVFGIFLTPVFYMLLRQRRAKRWVAAHPGQAEPALGAGVGHGPQDKVRGEHDA
jgi:hypothetical protein